VSPLVQFFEAKVEDENVYKLYLKLVKDLVKARLVDFTNRLPWKQIVLPSEDLK